MESIQNCIWRVHLGFLPKTLQFVHLLRVAFNAPWAFDALPAHLKYILLIDCGVRTSAMHSAPLDFRRLPARMEELHSIDGWMATTVIIDDLPPSMRIIRIRSRSMGKIVIGNGHMPAGFSSLVFEHPYEKKFKFEIAEESELAGKISARDACRSLYFDDLHKKAVRCSQGSSAYSRERRL